MKSRHTSHRRLESISEDSAIDISPSESIEFRSSTLGTPETASFCDYAITNSVETSQSEEIPAMETSLTSIAPPSSSTQPTQSAPAQETTEPSAFCRYVSGDSSTNPSKPEAPPDALTQTQSTFRGSLLASVQLSTKSRVLTLGLVLPICYFLICGGPGGIETIVSSSSPLIALIGLVAFPLLFSVPFTLLISEMCTAFPDDGGYVVWVTKAFGHFWGFQEGYWQWVATLLNNAFYPGVLLTSITYAFGREIHSAVAEYAIKTLILVVLALPTLFGTKVVGRLCILLAILVLVPFVVTTTWFFSKATDYEVLLEMPKPPINGSSEAAEQMTFLAEMHLVNWKTFIPDLFWRYDNIYFISVFGGQVRNPAYTFPRAIFLSLILAVCTYVLPLVGTLAVNQMDWRAFEDNTMLDIALQVSGSVLCNLLVISNTCSNTGLSSAVSFAMCYQVNGMAEQGLIPNSFSTRHKTFGTPFRAVLLNTLPVMALLAFDFSVLLEAASCLSAGSQILLIVAAIKLRFTRGDLYQFKKYPVGNVTMVLLMILPMTVVVFVFVVSLAKFAGMLVFIGVAYGLCMWQWCW